MENGKEYKYTPRADDYKSEYYESLTIVETPYGEAFVTIRSNKATAFDYANRSIFPKHWKERTEMTNPPNLILDRSLEYELFVILTKIKEHRSITADDQIKIYEIKERLDSKSYLDENRTQQTIMQDIAGKLYYINRLLDLKLWG